MSWESIWRGRRRLWCSSWFFWSVICASFFTTLWTEAGSRPAATHFSCSHRSAGPKKSKQKKCAPAVCDPFAALRGNLCCGVCGLRRGAHCALKRSVQTATANQFTTHARFGAHASPQTPHPRRIQKGGCRPLPCRAQRWHIGRPPLPFYPCREAQAQGWACAEGHTPSSSCWPHLFERSAPARSELCGSPLGRASQAAPAPQALGSRIAGACFFAYFLARARK